MFKRKHDLWRSEVQIWLIFGDGGKKISVIAITMTYSVVSLVVSSLEETILASLLMNFFKRPPILRTERHPLKYSKVRYHHFGGRLGTSNHSSLPRLLSKIGESHRWRVWAWLIAGKELDSKITQPRSQKNMGKERKKVLTWFKKKVSLQTTIFLF